MQAVLFLICIVSAGVLLKEMVIEPEQNRQTAEELKEEFLEEPSPGNTPVQETPKQAGKKGEVLAVDLMAMQAQYPDIQGWLTIPGTGIDYPVLQSGEEDQEYYLKRNYKGDWDVNGSLFLQWNCAVPEGQNLIIYGHNMNSGAMFGTLDKFTSRDYWREYKRVFFQTLSGISEYEIVSVMKADLSMFPFQKTAFDGESGAREYVRQAKSLGLFETEVTGDVSEHVLTLVTCSYEWDNARTVIVAVRKDKSISKNIS